jgi:DNA-binding transcriptional regulator WhiA
MNTAVDPKVLAYIIGVALGDGNLSRPNGRATRLRITCDAKYPIMASNIADALTILLPDNRVSIVRTPGTDTYFNISVYSNKLDEWMPWKVGRGSKFEQNARVPEWIKHDSELTKECLRGLIQTDGSIYRDRGYLMINFCNNSQALAEDVYTMLKSVGFQPRITSTQDRTHLKHTVRLAKETNRLIEDLQLIKA